MANKQFDGREIVEIDHVHTTTFMLAVQESNFLYSFTLSAFSALLTFLSASDERSTQANFLFIISGIYSIYGIIISIMLYGRKTSHDPNTLNRHTIIFKDQKAIKDHM